MKKLTNKILASTADAALEALIISAGLPSFCGLYQPKEPENLEKVVETRREAKKMVI